jgi:hypothetical protein
MSSENVYFELEQGQLDVPLASQSPIAYHTLMAIRDAVYGKLAILIITNGAPPTTANVFAPNCLAINYAGSTTTSRLYVNYGTTAASPIWATVTTSN